MGVIEDVYEDLDTDVGFEEFEAAVEDKVEQMGGLADEETAAMLIAHELRDQEVEGIADVDPGMDDVKFLAKVMRVGDLRTFERDDADDDGRVVNVDVADETGRTTITMWDGMAEDAVDRLEPGDTLRVAGRPKDGYNGLEVDVDKAEPAPDAEVDVESTDSHRVEDLSLGLSDVNLAGRVLSTDTVRTFDRDDGSEGRVSNLVLGDPTGRVRATLWDGKADLTEEFAAGETVEIVDGYVRERDGTLELHVGDRGTVETVDEHVEYVPETTDIRALELGETADVAGGVIETDPKRTFDRDDGSEGQVRNVRIKDETGDIRVALWGEKADRDIDLADYVVCTDVEVQDGWQDDLEASAGWQSTVNVMDDAPEDATDTGAEAAQSATGDGASQSTGLGAFSADGAGDADAGSGASSPPSGDAGPAGSASAAVAEPPDKAEDSAEQTETFTGTVVQAGSPVVLDNGTETRSVETDDSLRLGEKVTVTGPVTDNTIAADEIERVE
ncbi:replication protein A [Halobellus salinus]|uniref:Replication protein A n=1 Tax=Halobellus salinus TaxID=931585 RepID=A0A830EJR9_9EURY|nr:single-stranded DNA binding protein [Halobellus salinus]GGJ12047.1 replication protein A [Halobellus salinus]SMP02861.1 replication factor A1 [Halobellus salinus]